MDGSKDEIIEADEQYPSKMDGISDRYVRLTTNNKESSIGIKMFSDQQVLRDLDKIYGGICWLIRIDQGRNFCHSHDIDEILTFLLDYFDNDSVRVGLRQVPSEYLNCLILIEDNTQVIILGEPLGIKFDVALIFNDASLANIIRDRLTDYWSGLYHDGINQP